jgi:hypothetical protein
MVFCLIPVRHACLRVHSFALNVPAPAGVSPSGLQHQPITIAGSGGVLADSMDRHAWEEELVAPGYRGPAGGHDSHTLLALPRVMALELSGIWVGGL